MTNEFAFHGNGRKTEVIGQLLP